MKKRKPTIIEDVCSSCKRKRFFVMDFVTDPNGTYRCTICKTARVVPVATKKGVSK